ncbi:MAG: (Fe-S)-binding protein [Pseudomonadota bacterium]
MSLNTQQMIAEADRCVACGLCLPHCPTYHKTGSEADSPRGRIQLISAVAREILPANERYQQHINGCLSCRNCETACPNGVSYGGLIDSARAAIAKPISLSNRLANTFIQYHVLMRFAAQSLKLAQQLGLLKIVSALVPSLKKPIALLPELPAQQSWLELYPTRQNKKGDVSLFLGCISNTFDTDTLRASVFVLNRLGYDVHIPKTQACCGGLARQQGNSALAKDYIEKNNAAFIKANPVITVASGCGAGLKDYADLPIQDISAFLMQCDWQNIALQPFSDDIALHEPCTLRNVQKSHTAVMALLKKIPSANVQNLSGNAQCCGGAGAYMLTQPDMADTLLKDKLTAIDKSKAMLLATSNVGCALHIAAGLRAQNKAVKVVHPVTIIATQLGYTGLIN